VIILGVLTRIYNAVMALKGAANQRKIEFITKVFDKTDERITYLKKQMRNTFAKKILNRIGFIITIITIGLNIIALFTKLL
jgi:tetrahydromethanopterin S-methyltransferase subunit G